MRILLVVFILLSSLILTTRTYAQELIPPECLIKEGDNLYYRDYCIGVDYTGPLYPSIHYSDIAIGVGFNIFITLTVCFVLYLWIGQLLDLKLVVIGFVLTLGSFVADYMALRAANQIHNIYYSNFPYDKSLLTNAFSISLFFVGALILFILYYVGLSLYFKRKFDYRILLVSLVSMLINNPLWFFLFTR